MIHIEDKTLCCGCTACASICPKGAITMVPDVLGFMYPEVRTGLCIDCGLCEKVYQFNKDYDRSGNYTIPEVFAARHKEMHEIETSRSGAVFIALSDWILDHGGVVYGAGYREHFIVCHKRATTKEERNEFKGSKYVQSDLGDTFIKVKDDLSAGKTVMFSGTPCQTSGLKSFLSKSNVPCQNLYIIDVVCHGVPAPYIWRDYVHYIEERQKSPVTKTDFRDKAELGWSRHMESFIVKGRKEYRSLYTYLFYEHIMFRRSCEVCVYTNLTRPSDITLGDFWGWEKVDNQINADDKGVSLILVNTHKGDTLFGKIKNDIKFIRTDTEHCMQPNLEQPSKPNPSRVAFEQDYLRHGFIYVARKYGNIGLRYKLHVLSSKIKKRITR